MTESDATKGRRSNLAARFHTRGMSTWSVPSLPMTTSLATFLSTWSTYKCVHLQSQDQSKRRRTTRAAPPKFDEPLLQVLRKHSDVLEASFTAENSGSSSKSPSTAAELLELPTKPSRWYGSLVVSRNAALVSALLEAVPNIAPPCFAQSGGGAAAAAAVVQEDAVWLFIGRNGSKSDALLGRPPHTDEVQHEGTYHRQLSGAKEWRLRPTEELLERAAAAGATGGGRGSRPSAKRRRAQSSAVDADEEDTWSVVRCEEGDVLVVSTKDWWHSTSLPPCRDGGSSSSSSNGDNGGGGGSSSLSVSIAREWNMAATETAAARRRQNEQSKRCAADDGDDEDGEAAATSFINVEGLFASRAIPAGSVIFTEDEAPEMELPTVEDGKENCEVVEDDETGTVCLVAKRTIRSGEFLSVAAD